MIEGIMSWDEYIDRFQNLNVGRTGDHERPHKPVLLLAVLDLMDAGAIPENKIFYSPELLEVFGRYFHIVATDDDSCTPINPYFYLRGDKFWHHRPSRGQQAAYDALRNPGGVRALTNVIEHAYLDDELFSYLLDVTNRELARAAIIDRYFSGQRSELLGVAKDEKAIGEYQQALAAAIEGKELEQSDLDASSRSAGFRRIVTKAYDYRCAACGWRVILEDGVSIVDAAHLIPFSVDHDDDPRNGMALCKNHHWAMDRNLLAPGPDLKWHVRSGLDDRIAGEKELIALHRRTVILPHDKKYYPRMDALTYRIEQLKQAG